MPPAEALGRELMDWIKVSKEGGVDSRSSRRVSTQERIEREMLCDTEV